MNPTNMNYGKLYRSESDDFSSTYESQVEDFSEFLRGYGGSQAESVSNLKPIMPKLDNEDLRIENSGENGGISDRFVDEALEALDDLFGAD